MTSGVIAWEDGEAGVKSLTLEVKPFTTWEVEKMFVIELYQVAGAPPGIGDGEVDGELGSIVFTVRLSYCTMFT